MPARDKSLRNAFSKITRRKRDSVEDIADKGLDDALEGLTRATQANTEVCKKVKKRQSSGKLKLVSSRPPPNGSE